MKIDWIKPEDESPEYGRRIAMKLPDGRICSARVSDRFDARGKKYVGVDLEYVDNIDIIGVRPEWIYIDESGS